MSGDIPTGPRAHCEISGVFTVQVPQASGQTGVLLNNYVPRLALWEQRLALSQAEVAQLQSDLAVAQTQDGRISALLLLRGAYRELRDLMLRRPNPLTGDIGGTRATADPAPTDVEHTRMIELERQRYQALVDETTEAIGHMQSSAEPEQRDTNEDGGLPPMPSANSSKPGPRLSEQVLIAKAHAAGAREIGLLAALQNVRNAAEQEALLFELYKTEAEQKGKVEEAGRWRQRALLPRRAVEDYEALIAKEKARITVEEQTRGARAAAAKQRRIEEERTNAAIRAKVAQMTDKAATARYGKVLAEVARLKTITFDGNGRPYGIANPMPGFVALVMEQSALALRMQEIAMRAAQPKPRARPRGSKEAKAQTSPARKAARDKGKRTRDSIEGQAEAMKRANPNLKRAAAARNITKKRGALCKYDQAKNIINARWTEAAWEEIG